MFSVTQFGTFRMIFNPEEVGGTTGSTTGSQQHPGSDMVDELWKVECFVFHGLFETL
jgi:hypothetical protein